MHDIQEYNEDIRYWNRKSNTLICVCGSFGFIINQCSFPHRPATHQPVASRRGYITPT